MARRVWAEEFERDIERNLGGPRSSSAARAQPGWAERPTWVGRAQPGWAERPTWVGRAPGWAERPTWVGRAPQRRAPQRRASPERRSAERAPQRRAQPERRPRLRSMSLGRPRLRSMSGCARCRVSPIAAPRPQPRAALVIPSPDARAARPLSLPPSFSVARRRRLAPPRFAPRALGLRDWRRRPRYGQARRHGDRRRRHDAARYGRRSGATLRRGRWRLLQRSHVRARPDVRARRSVLRDPWWRALRLRGRLLRRLHLYGRRVRGTGRRRLYGLERLLQRTHLRHRPLRRAADGSRRHADVRQHRHDVLRGLHLQRGCGLRWRNRHLRNVRRHRSALLRRRDGLQWLAVLHGRHVPDADGVRRSRSAVLLARSDLLGRPRVYGRDVRQRDDVRRDGRAVPAAQHLR